MAARMVERGGVGDSGKELAVEKTPSVLEATAETNRKGSQDIAIGSVEHGDFVKGLQKDLPCLPWAKLCLLKRCIPVLICTPCQYVVFFENKLLTNATKLGQGYLG